LELILAVCLFLDPVTVFLSLPSEILLDESRIVFIDEMIHGIF
jgi:hypothetical protein